ncbi:MAG: DUF1428 domain-containing protein [Bdellovibrionales bacterium]
MAKAKYVDGFVIPIKKNKVAAYQKIAKVASKIWMKHGALDYYESVGEHLNIPGGVIPFTKMAKTKPGETVIFAWITYKSRAHRDSVNKKVMKDPAMQNFNPSDMPVTMNRMAYGGFKIIVSV